MKKKGFTLVELLAVIAILAILVIVAMPNVLGMFNQAKSSTFVTEVQTLMDTAKTEFMQKALTQQGKAIEFYSKDTDTINPLNMDGASKNYYIAMDRNGEFKRVVVWDKNFCYDSANGFLETLEKTDVKETNVKQLNPNNTDGVTLDLANDDDILSIEVVTDPSGAKSLSEGSSYCTGTALAN